MFENESSGHSQCSIQVTSQPLWSQFLFLFQFWILSYNVAMVTFEELCDTWGVGISLSFCEHLLWYSPALLFYPDHLHPRSYTTILFWDWYSTGWSYWWCIVCHNSSTCYLDFVCHLSQMHVSLHCRWHSHIFCHRLWSLVMHIFTLLTNLALLGLSIQPWKCGVWSPSPLPLSVTPFPWGASWNCWISILYPSFQYIETSVKLTSVLYIKIHYTLDVYIFHINMIDIHPIV